MHCLARSLHRSARTLSLAPVLFAASCAGSSDGRLWVHHVVIDHASKPVNQKDLKSHISLDETSWIPLSPKKWLEPVMLPLDKKRVEAWYHAHGYFSAQVKSVKVKPRGDGSADVVFDVDEGQPSRLRDLKVVGLEGLDEKTRKQVLHPLPLAASEPFLHDRYLDAKALVEGRLKALGHAWARVSGEADVDREAQTVDVTLRVVTGPKVVWGDILVDGDPSVNPWFVERRAPIRSGQPFQPDDVDATRGRIYALGLFSSVKVDVEPHPGDPTRADAHIHVTPGKKNELRLGFGVGIEPQRNDAHVKLQYVRRDFLGHLRTLRLRLEPGYVVVPNIANPSRQGPAAVAEAQLTQPDVFVRNLALKATVGYDLGVDYAFQFHGPRLALGLDKSWWHERLRVGGSYNFQYLMFFNTDPEFLSDPTLARRFFGYTNPYRLGYLLENASIDLRDHPLDPHKGAYLGVEAEEGSSWLGGGFSYERLTPDVRGYLPLGTRRLRLALRVEYGRMFHAANDDTPITRRLYAGGADSHRGFGYNRLSPQVPSGVKGVPPLPIGGEELFLSQVELRADLFQFAGNWAGGVLFWDAGDVPQRDRSLDFTELHQAVGAGLRYHTVVGTLRVDLGVRLNRLSATEADGRQNPDAGSRFAFHLSLGEAF